MLSHVLRHNLLDYIGFSKLFIAKYQLHSRLFVVSYSTASQTDYSATAVKKASQDKTPKLNISSPGPVLISHTESIKSKSSQFEPKNVLKSPIDDKSSHRQQRISKNADKSTNQNLQTPHAEKHSLLIPVAQKEKFQVSQTQTKATSATQHKFSKQSPFTSNNKNSQHNVKKSERTTVTSTQKSSNVRIFDTMYEERRSQAARTIFVRVSGESALDLLQNRCSRFGAVKLFYSALPSV